MTTRTHQFVEAHGRGCGKPGAEAGVGHFEAESCLAPAFASMASSLSLLLLHCSPGRGHHIDAAARM